MTKELRRTDIQEQENEAKEEKENKGAKEEKEKKGANETKEEKEMKEAMELKEEKEWEARHLQDPEISVDGNGQLGQLGQIGATSLSGQQAPPADGSSETNDSHRKPDSPSPDGGSGQRVSFPKLFRMLERGDVPLVALAVLGALVHGGATPGHLLLYQRIIDFFVSDAKIKQSSLNGTGIYESSLVSDVWSISRFYLVIALVVVLAGYCQMKGFMTIAERLALRLRHRYLAALLRRNVAWYDLNDPSGFANRLSSDVDKVNQACGEKLALFIQYCSTGLFGFLLGFAVDWKLTFIILASLPFLVATLLVLNKMTARLTKKANDSYDKAGSVAGEVFPAIRTVAAFGGEETEYARYVANLTEVKNIGVKKGVVIGVSAGMTFVCIFATFALAMYYGLIQMAKGNTTGGTIMQVFIGVLIGAMSLANAAPLLDIINEARSVLFEIYKIIDTEPDLDVLSNEGISPGIKGQIEFKNVFFNYPSRDTVNILNDVSIRVPVGQTVAFVGGSGSGKSTITQLVQRFYDIKSGQILIDGHEIKTLNLSCLRKSIGLVAQEPILFEGTIEENIKFGGESVQMEQMIEAAKQANAHDFISKFPDNYQTRVGGQGQQMSGGQKQRIAIARALVSNPKILILDEATSALDTQSESIVQHALDKHGEEKDERAVDLGDLGEVDIATETNLSRPMKLPKKKSFSIPKDAETKMLTDKEKAKLELSEYPKVSLLRVIRLNKPEWPYIAIGCFFSIGIGCTNPIFSVFFGEIFKNFAEDSDKMRSEATKLSILIFCMGLVIALCQIGANINLAISGEKLTKRLRRITFRKLIYQEVAWFDEPRNSVGGLTAKLSSDASKIQGIAGPQVGIAVQAVSTLTAALLISLYFGWQLALILILLMPFTMASGIVQGRMLSGKLRQESQAQVEASNLVSECLWNIRTVQSLTLQRKLLLKYRRLTSGISNQIQTKLHSFGFVFGISQSLFFCNFCVCLTAGAWFASDNRITFFNVFRVFGAIAFSGIQIGRTLSMALDITQAKLAAARIFSVLDRESLIDASSSKGEKLEKFKADINLEQLYFSYPTRPEAKVLQNLNLSIKSGSTVALVGTSGSGKSTSIVLLEQFYLPNAGSINLDGHNVSKLNLRWLRSQIGLVSQEPTLFSGTIAENIAYGDNSRKASNEEIIASAQKANIHNFVAGLPQGYDTPVGNRGAQLSGGQKQRIAIARALLRNPKILLLDEATSALDSQSEVVVQQALDKARKGRTCIIIAHRLSSIQDADVIVVIQDGRVVERGSHAELIAQQNFYYRLQHAQNKSSAETAPPSH